MYRRLSSLRRSTNSVMNHVDRRLDSLRYSMETRDYLAFVVSNSTQEDNLQIASSLAPSVRDFLSRLEAWSGKCQAKSMPA